MTVELLLRGLRSRWYVVLLGLALTVLAVTVIRQPTFTYWSRVTLVVLLPRGQATADNSLLSKTPTAIASLAVQAVNHGPNTMRAASSDATLVGLGERSATWVQLRNTGGQWVPSAGLPYVDIEAAAPTPTEVRRRISSATTALDAALVDLQARIGVPEPMRAFAEESTPSLVVDHASSDPHRAMAGALAAGMGLTFSAFVILTRRRTRWDL